VQVVVSEDGEITKQVKHMAMGRLAIELPYVMPDQKTVYITDDGTNVMLGMYKMTKKGDLSCGSLYGAKFNQTSSVGGVHRSHLAPRFVRTCAPCLTTLWLSSRCGCGGPQLLYWMLHS
jgi:hypothetical protein